MSTTKVQEKQLAQAEIKAKARTHFADSLHAVLEAEQRVSEMLGIARSEPEKYLEKVWSSNAETPAGLSSLPVTRFRAPGLQSAFAQANGMAKSGRRVAIFGSQLDASAERLPSTCAPYVAHRLAEERGPESTALLFELLARTPEQACHFAFIARRLAELALVPGILHSAQSYQQAAFKPVQSLTNDQIKSFLGDPADKIPTPTAAQQQFFGASRRRLPEMLAEEDVPDTALFWRDLLPLFVDTLTAFQQLTGIAYQPIEALQTDDADIVLVATGSHFDYLQENKQKLEAKAKIKIGLLHPTLLRPFPGGLITQHLKQKKACLVLSHANDTQSKSLLRKVRLAIDKAFANGLAEKQNLGTAPYPNYPVYQNLTDRPQLFSACAEELTVQDLGELLQQIANGKSKPQHDLFLSGNSKSTPAASLEESPKSALHLAMQTELAHQKGKIIAESFNSLLPFNLACFVSPQKDQAELYFSQRASVSTLPETLIDALIIEPDGFPEICENLDRLKKDGAVLVLGSTAEVSALWQSLSEPIRDTLKVQNLRFFAIDPGIDAMKNQIHLRGHILGALLKIAQLCNENLFSQDRVKAAIEAFASNGNLQFAQKAQSGFDGVTALDFHAIEQAQAEQLFDEQKTGLFFEQTKDIAASTGDASKAHMLFCQFGTLPAASHAPALRRLTPALLHGKTDLAHIRHAFPVCLPDGDPDHFAISLTDIFDDLIAKDEADEAEKERTTHYLLQLEAEIKRQVAGKSGQQLRQLWQNATDVLLKKADAKQFENRQKTYQAASQAITFDGPVINCDADAPAALFAAAMRYARTKRFADFEQEIDALSAKLAEILQADFAKSSDAHDPEYLKAAVGSGDSDELDFNQLANLLAEHPSDLEAQQKRAERIEEAWLTIKSLRTIFGSEGTPEPSNTANATLASALGQAIAHYRQFLEFFRAVHIARLEVMSRYREDRHDRYFAEFGFEHLSAQEYAMLPPFPIHLHTANWQEIDRSALIEVLGTELPLKVMVTIEDTNEAELLETGTSTAVGWPAKLASIAQVLDSAYVMQTVSSNLANLLSGLHDGLLYQGPALFSVYAGQIHSQQRIAPYLLAAAALEARVFPAFAYNPAGGDGLAQKMTILSTPEYEQDWSSETIDYRDAQSNADTMKIAFTAADFEAMHNNDAKHFLPVQAGEWHKDMMPIVDFVQNFEANAGVKVPYIWMANRQGMLYRTVVSYAAAAQTWRCLQAWNALQELGGINNSHAQKRIELEREQLAEAQQKAIETLQAEHKEQLDKAIGQVAEEIVANIAAGLLDQSSTAPVAMPKPAPAPATISATAAAKPAAGMVAEPEAEAEEEEEDDTLSLDEAYIETIRCTSCNECTNKNPRMFAYNADKQAYIKDINAGTYRELVESAEKCPVRIIHPGKPVSPDEPGLEELLKRAEPFL